MSEINVSLIQDEDVLRRMWQQTEDFSRKKEIRTHMYRLREERLRNLYSPEPKAEAKGCEFTSSATHVASFADQNFQSMKSKEVRDAGSPPKEFTYRGQDLKEYSNAGWNVESENSTQDGGATRVKALHATVEGRYDVEGGAGRFAAADSQRRAHTELHDDHSSLVRDETSSSTAARDHLVRTAPDGTHVTSSTSSSTTSNVKQVSETKTEAVPYVTEPDLNTVLDTNTDERLTRITNRNDYEQNTRRTDIDSGDLVSRKVEYPDDNTKVIVEMRCLPDGTRVTSTRREFRVPAQQTSSYQSRNETHSHSKQHRSHSDTRQSSTTTTRRTLDDRTTSADIVDTQRNRDDTDFRRQIRKDTTIDNNDNSAIHRTSELKTDRNVNDYSQTDNYTKTHYATRVNNEVVGRSTSDRNEYTQINRGENERISENVIETERQPEVIATTRDNRTPKRDVEDIHHKSTTEQRVHNVTKDSKVEKIVERKTTSDLYQTTYQTDYQQRKVSEDLSPTHQAWASTLRSDTPSTPRPSTRGSSPGSRTFQSSTSSLRSSVSPDKYRKPSSRGGSPGKIDRYSPTRTVTSDRYSDTHSTYSVTETKTNKYTSPERKPPTGQRSSTSPEKRPQAFRPSPSPERKSTQFTPDPSRSSPTGRAPSRSPTRPRRNPEKPGQSQYPRTSSPSRTYTPNSVKFPEASPEREVGYRTSSDREPQHYVKRPSSSPDRKPGYMRPTTASQPTTDTKRPSRPGDQPDRKSPSKLAPTSPDRNKTTKVVEDHYTFVDEETKVNIRNQNVRTDTIYKPSSNDSSPHQKSTSPKRQTPKDSESSRTPNKPKTSQKDTVMITENDELYGIIDKTVEIIDIKKSNDTKISKSSTKDSSVPEDKNVPKRETSPSKYDTYNKKTPRETISTEITNVSIDDSTEYDTLTRDENVKKTPEPLSPTKKSPRDITSPTKISTKDVKHKHTTDFISTEINTEEINKKNMSKNRPRQLMTPSSSPTRKPKAAEPEPSTGQSSPTTSVSGFVYFGSPRNERPLITDLDDESDNVDDSSCDRPDTLDVKRSPTPSKIPCRSPSPEQRPSLARDNLPRKSSLKKPSVPSTESSPMEKPPTSFRVSPTEDKPNVPDHKVVRKDQPVGTPVKPKPPLQRRETYEDRCRKILGMIEDTTTETVTKETKKHSKRTESERSSPSVSPCDSPAPKETSPFPEFTTIATKVTDTKSDVTDFICREIDENIKSTKILENKTPYRDNSPAKLQDIISKTTSVIDYETKSINKGTKNEITCFTTRKSPSKDIPRRLSTSTEKTTQQTPTPATRSASPTKPIPAERTSVSPTRKPSRDSPVKNYPRDDSPTNRENNSVYSTTTTVTSDTVEDITNRKTRNKTRSRILESPNRDDPASKPRDNFPKYKAQDNLRKSPEKSPTRTTAKKNLTSGHDTSITERTDITKTTNKSVSPTRKSLQNQPRESSPSKSSNRTPKKPEPSPEHKPTNQEREPQKSYIKSSSPARPHEELPRFIKTTTSSITKHKTITGEENITSKRSERKHSSSNSAVSPTRKPSDPRTPSPTKTSRPSDLPKKFERSPERKSGHQQPSSTVKSTDNHPATKSPSRPSPDKVPGYMKTTTSTTSKFDTTSVSDVHDTFTSVTDKYSSSRPTGSPRSSPDRGTPNYRSGSPSKPSITNNIPRNRSVSPDHKPKDSAKIPGYMKPTEAAIHKFESTMVTDVEESSMPTDRSESPSSDRSMSPDSTPKIPGYMRPTEAVIHKFDSNLVTDVQEIISSRIVRKKSPELTDRSDSPSSKRSLSPSNKPKDAVPMTPGYMRPTEAVIHKIDSTVVTDVEETIFSKVLHRKSPEPVKRRSLSPDYKPKVSVLKTPGYMRPTEAVIHKFDSTLETDVEETIISKTKHTIIPEPADESPDFKDKKTSTKTPGYMRPTEAVIHKYDSTTDTEVEHTVQRKTPEPTDYSNRRISIERKVEKASKDTPTKLVYPTESTLRSSVSPGRKHSHNRPTASTTSKFDSKTVTEDITHNLIESVEQRQLRTPSPIKKTTTQITDVSSEFILSEKEQEILDKVHKSLRKLSPDSKEKSPSPPSRERSPNKSTLSLEDLDIITTSETELTHKLAGENLSEVVEENVTTKTKIAQPYKPTDKSKVQKITSKPTSRNASPTKKTPSTPVKIEKNLESPTKSRSISPKKPLSQSERPQSPKVSKVSGIKQREPLHSVLTRKPTPATIKIERLPSEIKRTNGVSKQTTNVKTTTTSTAKPLLSPTRKNFDLEPKRTSTPRGIKEPSTSKKETVTRTTSDNSIKPKKTSPQRMRSKPEIQISDMSHRLPKSQKPSKLPTKPKSATALNMSLDDEDFTVDLQQSKSSRENSPDRICPTPVNFNEDVGTPRFPDEVSEPDDEYRRHTHHTIHETESVVDDIVEICEDEELFIKKADRNLITEEDDSILSVTDKVTKFTNKIESVKKPKDTFSVFNDTERRVHSDFTAENLKSDECLLSVSEKVNKFVKGPRDLKDNRSSTKRIVDEYDNDTIYQDDYTKLSVNDKTHLFVETAENIKVSKPKPAHKVERPDLSNVEESLKSDECLLSVSDKVNKFVKTAEQFMTDTTEVEEKEKKIKKQHERVIKQIIDDEDDKIHDVTSNITTTRVGKVNKPHDQTTPSKVKDFSTPKSKPTERTPPVKITTLRSSEAVKKAKALFENIASTQIKEVNTTKATKLTDIGVINKSSKTDSTTVLHPSVEDISPNFTDGETEIISQTPSHKERPSSEILNRPHLEAKPRSSPNRQTARSPEVPRSKSPIQQSIEVTSSKTVLSRYPAARAESPSYRPESLRPKTESDKQVPGYLKPTKTSQLKEETKVTEESEVSTRRGSGKFGVELRRTSVERSTVSSERRRSVEHHQPCIEDIYDLDLLEQMLEKVTGYEQRRRIRSQIRIVKKESEHVDSTNTYTKIVKQTTHVQTSSPRPRSPQRQPARSPERNHKSTPQKTTSPDRLKSNIQKTAPENNQFNQAKTTPYMNGHTKEPVKNVTVKRQRPASPEKPVPKSTARNPVRHPSPEKKRTVSPTKITPKQKPNRFNEYASAYMKKIQPNETDKVKMSDIKNEKVKDIKQTVKHVKQENVQEFTTSKSFSERTSSKNNIDMVQVNGKRSPSPEKRQSPVRKHQSPERTAQSPERKTKTSELKAQSPERLYQRTPSPDFKRPRADAAKETLIKTIYDVDKKIPKAAFQEEKPSWVTNRNLKKITSETRTFSSKKIEMEKPKYRAASPSKVIVKPTDVITSSYGPGPLDADGKPLFGIKALRNGATNFQVKGTVIRQEYHSRNGGEPEGTVSVTAYSSQPEDLQQLLEDQSVEPPSRLHGLSAITTTKKFGGDTGNTYSNVHTKEERASLEQFTHTDRKIVNNKLIEDVSFDDVDTNETSVQTSEKRKEEKEVKRGQKMERKEDKKNVRQSSVKSLTEKFIKSANDTGKVDRSSYPKAGLILRTTTLRDSVSSDDAPGLHRTDSEHSLNDEAFEHVESTRTSRTTRTELGQPGRTRTTVTDASQPGRTRTTVTETSGQPGRTTRTVRTTTVVQEPVVTSVTRTERSFLDSNTKVTGVQDILTRMKNADVVVQEGDSSEEHEARALLNKFLGATVLMAGMQGYVNEEPMGKVHIQESSVRSSSAGNRVSSGTRTEEIDLDHCWDEQLLRKLLDECTDYEQRRRLRARIRSLMAEQEACANAVTEALGCAAAEATRADADGAGASAGGDADLREEEEVTVSSSVRRDSTEKTVSSSTTTKTSKVLESMTRPAPKPVSPFAKFRQLEKQNSTNSPNSPKTPQSPGSPSQPYFKFTDPALQTSALTIKERLLQWCRDKTRDYENVKLENFSTSWADGLAFCALVHHFLPDAFDYSKLTADKRRHNFTLAFKVADEKAGIYPLLDVDDMVAMRKPDWKCVFTYVQSIYRRFKDER